MTVDTMKMTSRQRIFDVIRKRQLVTVSELNHFLDMTPANIRHHLSVLKSDGLVECMGERKKIGRGRPEAIYSVSNILFEDGLETLIEGILNIWFSSSQPEQIEQNLQAIAKQIALNGKVDPNLNINRKLANCMSYLNGLHYMAQWEAGHSGPRLLFGNCPYRKIISKHPELCKMDKYLLEELLGNKISQVSKLERDERGKFYCSFIGH